MSNILFNVFVEISGRSQFISDGWISLLNRSSISNGQRPCRTLLVLNNSLRTSEDSNFEYLLLDWSAFRIVLPEGDQSTAVSPYAFCRFIGLDVPNFVAHLISRLRGSAAEKCSRPNLRDREPFPAIDTSREK